MVWNWLFRGGRKDTGPAPAPLPDPYVVNDDLIALIKHYESFSPVAYWDKHGNVWTIGYGSTYYKDGRRVKSGENISIADATELLTIVVMDNIRLIKAGFPTPLERHHVTALTSFLYNVGPGRYGSKDGLFALRDYQRASTLWRMVLAGDLDAAASQFKLWNKSGGVVLKGLQRRRRAEEYIFSGRIKTAVAAYTQAEKDFP